MLYFIFLLVGNGVLIQENTEIGWQRVRDFLVASESMRLGDFLDVIKFNCLIEKNAVTLSFERLE